MKRLLTPLVFVLAGFLVLSLAQTPNWVGGAPQRIWLSWPADNGLTYRIWYKTNSADVWKVHSTIERPLIRVLIDATNAECYYRLEILPP
jgi:hypothetical protein